MSVDQVDFRGQDKPEATSGSHDTPNWCRGKYGPHDKNVVGRKKRDGSCMECAREYMRRRIAADPERHREASRRWRAANLEGAREINREYMRRLRATNPRFREREREASRRWREANPEKVVTQQVRYGSMWAMTYRNKKALAALGDTHGRD
jgi:hypothetical protein